MLAFKSKKAVPDVEESPADADIETVFSQVIPSAPFALQDYKSIDENENMKNDKFDEVLLAIAQSMAESSRKAPPETKASDEPTRTKCEKRAASEEADAHLSSKKIRTSEDQMETPEESPATQEAVRTHESLDPAGAVNAWQEWVQTKNAELEKSSLSGKRQLKLFKTNLMSMTPEELNYALCLFIKEVRQCDGTAPSPCRIYLLCLGIQQYLHEQGRQDNIFADPQYEMFIGCFHSIFSQAHDTSSESQEHIREEVLWQARQLGDHSPAVLLNTLMYFNVKYFQLHTVDQHLQLTLADVTELEQESVEGGQPIKILRSTAASCQDPRQRRFRDVVFFRHFRLGQGASIELLKNLELLFKRECMVRPLPFLRAAITL
ncbi:hypothetical protein HPB51_002632 [Rhipicephalus microplus]|uniref:DUF3504 domain-containing protein n=1 Tax=Rhipicephalus microplus TaxID=6941 RepID=A0A9J6DFC6_RHIMP|nr:hypothetical protein HPB51_002632 [Rhipicephalus microplus]